MPATGRKLSDRLLENPEDFANELKIFYNDKISDEFKRLLTEHLQIGGDLVNADKAANMAKADELRKRWYANADEIAAFLSLINPYWNQQKWRDMMYSHLSMTEKETVLKLKKEYPKDIKMFEHIEKEALDMADYMSTGIIRKFCCDR